MSQTRQSQATQDMANQKSDKEIMSEVVKSAGHHITGIGPTLRKSVIDQRGSSSQQSSSEQSASKAEVDALHAEVASIKADYVHLFRYMAEHFPQAVQGRQIPSPPTMSTSGLRRFPRTAEVNDDDEDEEEEDQDDANLGD